MTTFVQILVSGTVVGSVLALVALGYSLVFSATRVVNFSHGSMLAVGGFVAFAAVRAGLPVAAALVVATVGSGLIGVLVHQVALRPLGRFDPSANTGWIVSTFAVSLIALDLLRITIGAEPRQIPPLAESILGWQGGTIAGVPVGPDDFLVVLCSVLCMLAVDRMLAATMVGRGLRAVAQDRTTAASMGINPDRMVSLAFAISGALAGLGAVLLAPKLFVKLDNGLLLGIQAFVAAVLGGLGSTRGATLGGFALGFTGAIVRSISTSGSRYEPLVVFVLFLAVLVFRPQGLLGQPGINKV